MKIELNGYPALILFGSLLVLLMLPGPREAIDKLIKRELDIRKWPRWVRAFITVIGSLVFIVWDFPDAS